MEYISTRDNSVRVKAATAIAQGISAEGGLFVPVELPKYTLEDLVNMKDLSYANRAVKVLSGFLDDFTQQELESCVNAAYNKKAFAPDEVTPINKIDETAYSLELWHGPTCAFKDMALQLLPHLLTTSMKKVLDGKEVVILVATSGDTGKAALEGFKDVDGTRIIVFYPDGGVSPVQFKQMATQEGRNVAVFGVEGNFDDTQTGVKKIFTNAEIIEELAEKNLVFSSANSINWGRLVPQIVYYVSSYCDMMKNGEIEQGEKINVCVPTGNFGNILAAYYAKQMGVPIDKLICASNINNVLTDFINTGEYDRRRDFKLTSSPSMDILISSNLERLLFELYGDDSVVSELMAQLVNDGVYKVSDEVLNKLQSNFYGGYLDEDETAEVIRDTFKNNDYLCDTHTAVAVGVYRKYLKETNDKTKTIIASTANPYKFAGSMLEALEPGVKQADAFAEVNRLHEITGLEIPEQIAELDKKEERFKEVCKIDEMKQVVQRQLGIV